MPCSMAYDIDNNEFTEILGTIAGDDTIMCAIGSVDETLIVMDKLNKLIQNSGD